MSGFKEYDKYDAMGLADLVKKKKVKPAELCEEAISRINKLNPALNAVITPMYDIARKTAAKPLPKGPFTGVPFLLKDYMQAYGGVRMACGCRAYRNYISKDDSELVRRFKQTGVVIAGKTNTPEFGLMAYTEPELFGPTKNPWNMEYTPGGSSGGSAAAVASGMVHIAGGNDGGGSIRNPSSCCGLFGLKPTRGRTPAGPDYGTPWQGAVVNHIITRSVRDSAAMLDATQGADAGAPYEIQRPARPYLKEIMQKPGKLNIAFTRESFLNIKVHAECVKAVEETAKMLAKLGHHVEEAKPDISEKMLARSFVIMYFGETAADIDMIGVLTGRKAGGSDIEPLTRVSAMLGRVFSARDFANAMRDWNTIARTMGHFHKNYDCLLTPTLPYPPFKIGALQPKPGEKAAMSIIRVLKLGKLMKMPAILDSMAEASLSVISCTLLANVTGQPAMSVPLYWTADGLPVGVQFMARFGDEATLFRLAAQLEKAKPWFNLRPQLKV
jgi:amidase